MSARRPLWLTLIFAVACAEETRSGPDASMDAFADVAIDRAAPKADAAVDTLMAVWPPPTTYQVKSAMLSDPDTHGPAMAVSCADFWKKARDNTDGGFFTFVDNKGVVGTSRDKSFVAQSRLGVVFAHSFMLTGDETYLAQARAALDFLYAHGWDQSNGGWFFTGDPKGVPLPGGDNDNKWSFVQHYSLFGPLAMCEATRNATDCEWTEKGRASLEKLWDSSPSRFGYYDYASLAFTGPSGKGFTPTVDGLGTNALLSYLLTGSAEHRQRVLDLADNVLTHLVPSLDLAETKYGFVEFFDADWNVDTLNRGGFTGHVFKTAWQLARVYLMNPDARYRIGARRLLHAMWDEGGFDKVNGAPNGRCDWGQGLLTSEKSYWEVEQGFTSGITSFFIEDDPTEREMDLEIADRSIDFLQRHFMDTQWGGMYFGTSPDGAKVTTSSKSDKYESGHHCVETGYYGYLYGNLLYRRRPATLYYHFAAATARQIRLSPLTMDDGRVQISAVELDGKPFATFTGPTRTLDIPAGVGGKFKVTFQPVY